jgi:uncharacterized protein
MIRKLSFGSFALVLLSGLVSGCGQATTAGPAQSSGQTVLFTKADASSIQVQGRGETTAITDTGYFDVGVEVTAPSVATARQRAAQAATRVIATLEKNGVEKKDLQTAGLNINPTYGHDSRITGYSVSTSVNVTVRNLDAMGKLIDDATEAGGDASRVSSVRFGIANSDGLKTRAREKAVEDARRRAEELAKLSGVKLGAPLAIEEIAVMNNMPVPYAMAEGGGGSDRMPIERGSGMVAIEVRVRWSIQG